MKDYRVGIYARLSRDDERQGESVSIENQKLMLRRHCEGQGWMVAGEYVDDGWSGTNFERPAFRRLMEDVQQKKVNLVLVKDLSRLGRDYIEVGKYTDCVFPCYGCRFVALNDGVDTLRQNDDVAMIFKNVINDIYARDTSRKIRAVRRANAESGKFMGYKAPYGYQKSIEDKHCLVVDPPAADVVCRIFSLRKSGLSVQAVADELNERKILPPREYALSAAGKPYSTERTWSRETVRAILRNEAYIGNLVQLKQGSLSYKDHRQRSRPPEAWVRVEHTHTPVIDQETWQAVRELEQREHRPRRKKDGEQPLLSGLLYCRVCGRPMRWIVNRKKRSGGEITYMYYSCKGHVFCPEDAIKEVLRRKLEADLAVLSLDVVVECAEKLLEEKRGHTRNAELCAAEKRLAELDGLMRRLYEDFAGERVAPAVYERLMEQYQREAAGQEERRKWLVEKRDIINASARERLERLWKEPVCRLLLPAVIERIEVAPKEKDGESRQKLWIHYKYNGVVSL